MRKTTFGAMLALATMSGGVLATVPAGAASTDMGSGAAADAASGNAANNERQAGQVDEFVAYSDASQESPRTGTDAWAWSVFRVFADRIEYSTTVFGLDENLTAAHLHMAPRGVAGPVVVPLTGDIVSRTRVAGTISPGEIQGRSMRDLLDAIRNDGIYVNFHTATHPDGAIRGQLVRNPSFERPEAREYDFALAQIAHDPARDGGSSPSGRVQLRLDGDQLTVRVKVEGLAPGLPHAQHLHGFLGAMPGGAMPGGAMPGGAMPGGAMPGGAMPGGAMPGDAMMPMHGDGAMAARKASCPTMRADVNGDGLINTTEGHSSYGDIQVSLTTSGDTSPASGLAVDRFPVADAAGRVNYERTFTVSPMVAEHLGDLALVTHGVDVNNNGAYDFGIGPSDLDASLPGEATLPAACGAPVADMGHGGRGEAGDRDGAGDRGGSGGRSGMNAPAGDAPGMDKSEGAA